MRKTIAIVATYNEASNVQALTAKLLATSRDMHVLIVDDNSPDHTGDVAEELASAEPRLTVLHRPSKRGLAAALREGFQWALGHGFDCLVNIDGDLSHDPSAAPTLIEGMNTASLVIGSRYVKGGRTMGWPMYRRVLSRLAGLYVRTITGLPYCDPTSGFRCFSREALEVVIKKPSVSVGYMFHIEALYKVWRAGLPIVEVPIAFKERAAGATKMDFRILMEGIELPWRLECSLHTKSSARKAISLRA